MSSPPPAGPPGGPQPNPNFPPPGSPAYAAKMAAKAAAMAAFEDFTVEAWTLLGVGILVTILRTYSRIKTIGIKGLQVDDYLVWVGLTFYAIETALAYQVGHTGGGMANNGLTPEQRATLPPDHPEWRMRVIGSKIQLCGWASYTVLLWSLKASLLVFYMRLTAGLKRSYRIRINIGFGLLAASFVALVLNLFLTCRPFHKNWQINPDPGNACQPAISKQIIWMYLSMNVATDLYLISIPVPMLWQSTLRPVKKAGLIVLFSGGLFVVAAATLRVVMIVTDPVNGAQLAGSWAVRETFVAVVVTNLPMVYPLFKTGFTAVFSSLLTSMRSSKQLDGSTPKNSKNHIQTFGGGGGGVSKGSRGTGGGTTGSSFNPMTNVTFNESEERMIEEYKMEDWSSVNSARKVPPSGNNIRKNVDVTVFSQDRSATPDTVQRQPDNFAYGKPSSRGRF